MAFIKTEIEGVIIFEPQVFTDGRGYFFESYNKSIFASSGITCEFVQDNEASSQYGVIRGLHFQKGKFAQAKLVRVTSGAILDVAVDMREGSPYYGSHISVELSAENKKQLFVPRGFAHGYSVLSEQARVIYKCDNFYNKASEGGIIYNDKTLAINWRIPKGKEIISDKDLQLKPFLGEN
jgi:dTDP-4-dehydrorhamnose 3,5-epimerase